MQLIWGNIKYISLIDRINRCSNFHITMTLQKNQSVIVLMSLLPG